MDQLHTIIRVLDQAGIGRLPALAKRIAGTVPLDAIVIESLAGEILGWIAFTTHGCDLVACDGELKADARASTTAMELRQALVQLAADRSVQTIRATNNLDRFSFGAFLHALGFNFEASVWRCEIDSQMKAEPDDIREDEPNPRLWRRLDRFATAKSVVMRTVDASNWKDALSFDMLPEQYFFCSGAVYSLLESAFSQNMHCCVAYAGGKPFSFFMFERHSHQLFEIHRNFVAKEEQRGMLPALAVRGILKHLRFEYEGDIVRFSVMAGNQRARRLYASLGGRQIDEKPNPDSAELFMEIDLHEVTSFTAGDG